MKNLKLMINITQFFGFVALCFLLIILKPKDRIIQKPIYVEVEKIIYRDTCDSHFIKTIGEIETGNNDSLSGDSGMGRGRFGIYDICLTGTGFKDLLNLDHSDMHNKEAAMSVFWGMMGIFCHEHYKRHGHYPTYEELARKWCGGPNGETKKATLKYLSKFKQLYNAK